MPDFEFLWESRVAVDSGQLSIADPSYWSNKELSYDKILEAEHDPESPTLDLGFLEKVEANMAVVFPTTIGDGVFDVFSVWKGEEVQGMFVSFVNDFGLLDD